MRGACGEVTEFNWFMTLDGSTGVYAAPCSPPAGKSHQPLLGHDDIARPQCRIVGDVERREAELVTAVAGAIRHEVLAKQKCIFELTVVRAIARDGAVDLRAEEHLGLARRTHRPAGLDRRGVGEMRNRKALAVA